MSASGHESEMPALLVYVGYWGKIGKHMLNASSRILTRLGHRTENRL